MNKNVVKLTENELKRIVNESVQSILSELDWKTYANAAKKRSDQYHNALDNNNYKEASKLRSKVFDLQDASDQSLLRDHPNSKDKRDAIQDYWDGKYTYYKGEGWLKDESSHDNFTQSIYNIHSIINKAMTKAEKGQWRDEVLSRLNAFCQDYIDTYEELLSQMK